MDDDIVRGYLWQQVIRLAFSPAGKKEQKKWLRMHSMSLKDFWETDEYPPHPKSNGTITGEFTSSNLLLDYSISDNSNFAVRLVHLSNTKDLIWTHDVDSGYFAFPIKSILSKYGKGKQLPKKGTSKHVESVLDGLIFHPRVHQHVKSPLNNHEIRIGGGIDNPFLFLFHLRYQLCPIPEKRNNEKKRLTELFTNAIKNKSKNIITPNELLMKT